MSSHTARSFQPQKRDLSQSNFCLGWHVLTFGALVLLPEGAYLGTCKRDSVVSVQRELPVHSFSEREKRKWFSRRRPAGYSSPCVNAGAF